MASITISVPDAQVQRVLDAFCNTFGYNPDTDGTKAAFAKKQIALYAREVTLAYEANLAVVEAQKAYIPPSPVDAT